MTYLNQGMLLRRRGLLEEPSNITVQAMTYAVDDTDRVGPTPYITAPVALSAGKLYLLAEAWTRNSANAPASGVVQAGATWTQVATVVVETSDARHSLWRCQPASNVAAATIAIGPTAATSSIFCHWSIIEFDNVYDDSANNGAGCIVQMAKMADNPAAGSSIVASLASPVSAPNAKFGTFYARVAGTTSLTPTGCDEITDTVSADPSVLETCWRIGDGTSNITSVCGTTDERSGIGVEIRAM